MIYVPPMAASDVAGVQHRQRFDALGANGYETVSVLPARCRSGAAVAGSLRSPGVRQISGLRLIALFRKLASSAPVFGPCAGFPICAP